MTRRIALAILMIVWLSLLTAGVATYLITRAVLIADLDQTILGRVASLPDVERPAALPAETRDIHDRFVIQNPQGAIISSSSAPTSGVPAPIILNAGFTQLANGTRQRSLTIQAFARRAAATDPLVPIKIIYSAPADRLDALLTRLLICLVGFGLFAAVATAAVAKSVARAALRPMRDTAEAIGAIDERSLDRRIDVARLPPELAPVGTRLNGMLARLETAFAQRKQFLADASHELRTPVAGLVTTLEVVLRKNRELEDYRRALESSLGDARLLQQLVIGLLEQVRSERFSSELELAPVYLPALLNQCANLGAALAAPKNIALHRDFPEESIVVTDEPKLRSILTNLLSNAVEYTAAGGNVWFTATVELLPGAGAGGAGSADELAGQKACVHFSVADDGPGIAPEHLPHLFEPFYRADAARTDSEQHLGLGLALVRGNARTLGGDCTVISPRPGAAGGCEFHVEIQAERRPAAASTPNHNGRANLRAPGESLPAHF